MKIQIYGVDNSANKEQSQAYVESELLGSRVRLSDNFAEADGSYKLILKAEAVREVFDFIEWDAGPQQDYRVEQGGVLLGRRYFDEAEGIHYVVVSKAFPARQTKASIAFLEITAECWSQLHAEKDAYNCKTGAEAVIVGWFHTHPNTLSCFMSQTDRNTQAHYFAGENTYAMVLNPQRRLFKAFRSGSCEAAQAILMLEESGSWEG